MLEANPREFTASVGSALVESFRVSCVGPSASGFYTLISINDLPLPLVVEGVEIIGVTLELDANGTFVLVESYRDPPGAEPTRVATLAGEWSLDGIELTLDPDDEPVTLKGTFEGDDIVFLFGTDAYRFRK